MDAETLELDPGFIDREDIVARLHFLEHMESRWPYSPAKDTPLADRIARCLTLLPNEYRSFALAAFANVVYLPTSLLTESWEYLAHVAAEGEGLSVGELIESAHFLEVDESGLVVDFLHENGVHGRLDTDRFSRLQTIDDLARALLIVGNDEANYKAVAKEIQLAFAKRYWLVLTDNVLSGTSLKSDLERCRRLIHAYSKLGEPRVVPIVQVLTSTAERNLADEWPVVSALRFDERFKIEAGNKSCTLFSSMETLEGVVELSRWLASQEYFQNDDRLLSTIDKSGDDMALGFKGGGWTLVTPNCPTNSLPILWYVQDGLYEGPFPRIMSRTSQVKGSGGGLTDAAEAMAPEILARIEATCG